MYEAIADPYCYRGSSVLKNRLGLRAQSELDAFEADATAQRFAEPLPEGRFTASHYRAVHRHIFGDVYRWAGRLRTVRIAKGDSMFCYPEHIANEMTRVFSALRMGNALRGLTVDGFASEAARFLADINAIHPFRDGNGRTQLAFVAALAAHAGHPFDLKNLQPDPFLQAAIKSFHGSEAPLASEVRRLVQR